MPTLTPVTLMNPIIGIIPMTPASICQTRALMPYLFVLTTTRQIIATSFYETKRGGEEGKRGEREKAI